MILRCALAGLLLVLLGFGQQQPFSISNVAGVDWFRDSAGDLFFSNGVNVVDDKTAGPKLKSWGFNTIGAWSDPAYEEGTTPFTVELHLGSAQGFPWCDFFGDAFAAGVDAGAQSAARKYRSNPRLLGYFSDNELGWWGPTIFLYQLHQPEKSATRQKLLALLREYYRDDFSALQKDFLVGKAAGNWQSLQSQAAPELWIRPGGHAMTVIGEFIGAAAERYYSVTTTALRKADPGHLVLGDRYAGYFERPIAEAAGRNLDVVSTNYGAEFLDGSLTNFYLESLHQITRKPVMATEYYFAATENRSRNTNRGNLFPTVRTQADRARSFARNLAELAARPYVIGAHWFQFRDEPTGGRPGDGEDYNMGLVDTHGIPYAELTGAAAKLDVARIHQSATSHPSSRQSPIAPADPWKGLLEWPRERAFVTPEQPTAPADLYVCHDRDFLWLGIQYMDFAEPKLYRTKQEFEQDLPIVEIDSPGSATITVRLLLNGLPKVSTPHVKARLIGRGIRSAVIIQIPRSRSFRCRLRSSGGAWTASWTWKQ